MAKPPILTLTDITLSFGGNPVFDGLGMTVQESDRVCLVGRNGSGKSTLMKVIAGLIEPDQGNIFLRPGQKVGYMDQHPDLSNFETLGDYARSEIDIIDAYKVDIIAEGLKLNLDASPATASGGERRRSALVKIMAEEPELMLLDEPTNHLDIEAIQWLEDELRQTKKAFILISHDRAFLRNLTRATLWVDRGKVRQNPKGFEAFEDWRDKTYDEEDQQRHKLNRLIKSEARWAVEGISARRKRNQGRVRRLIDLKDERSGQIKRQGAAAMEFADSPKSGKLVVDANNISKTFEDKNIVNDLSIKITRGERIALVGPNGVGKTTVLNILTGSLVPDTGTVKLGVNLLSAIFDQNRSALNPNQSLWESLTEDKDLGVSGKNDQIMVRGNPKHVVGYLKEFLFDENQARGPVSVLSGGEKARLLLSRIMARESNLLVMDEPTNDLDFETIKWLENFISNYDNTCIVVSHDRHFLDSVCTHISDIDFGKINNYSGNYTFWYESSQLALRQKTQQNRKSEEKKKELEDFIARFSANASKSKQATSRKKMLDNLKIEDIKPSSRRYPAVIFTSEREAGDQILSVENLSYSDSTSILFDKIDFNLNKGDKVVLYSKDTRATTAFYEILNNQLNPNTGRFDWGITTSQSYLPLDNNSYFREKISLVDWLRQWSKNDEEREEVFIRGFLGKMIFSGEEALKNCDVLSGGEKVRCMLSRMMMLRSNVLMFDEPTSHLDLESITALNNSIKKFKGNVILSTHDFEFAKSVGNRVIELTPKGVIDRLTTFDSYINDPKIKELRSKLYS